MIRLEESNEVTVVRSLKEIVDWYGLHFSFHDAASIRDSAKEAILNRFDQFEVFRIAVSRGRMGVCTV